MKQEELVEKIKKLKKERNAVILAHNYQRPEIQEIADYLGDSFDLSLKAREVDSEVIVFCGVRFMAESAKILSPEKTILLPEKEASCPLADTASPDQLRELRKNHPEAMLITYINTTAEVKAESDICCTSANAVKIIKAFPNEKIAYIPDQNLARYAEKMLDRSILKWEGYCYVHHENITAADAKGLISKHPEAVVMAHPECPPDVLELCDYVTGTAGMVKIARQSEAAEFIVLTESGLADRLKRENPEKEFYVVRTAVCESMKLTTLQSLHESLRDMKHEITVPDEVRERALNSLNRMLEYQ